jgi:hypothetical protein
MIMPQIMNLGSSMESSVGTSCQITHRMNGHNITTEIMHDKIQKKKKLLVHNLLQALYFN